MAATTRTEAIRLRLESRLPLRLQRIRRQSLKSSVDDDGNSERALLSDGLRNIHAPDGLGFPRAEAALHPLGHLSFDLGEPHDFPVGTRRHATGIDLRDPPHTHQCAGAGPEHQLLQTADLLEVPRLRCREDTLPQTPYVILGLPPADGLPVKDVALRSVHRPGRSRHGSPGRPRHVGVQLAPRFQSHWSSILHRPT
jgi:hypothetical protein